MRVGEVITAEVVRIEHNFVVVNAGLKSEAYVPIEEFKNDQGEARSPGRRLRLGGHRRRRERLRRHHPVARQGQAPGLVDVARELARVRRVRHRHGQRQGQGRPDGAGQRHPRLPARLAARHAPGQGHEPVRGQDHGVQGHQARPQAQQRRVVAPRRGRGLDGRRARQAAGDAAAKAPSSTAWSRTSPSTARSSTSAASTACCTSPTWPGAACATRARWCRSARNSTAKVLKFDAEKNRVSLGIKQLGDDPWHGVSRRYPNGTRLFGKITNIADYGAFVEIEPGIEGLVHVSEMDWTNKNVAPEQDRLARRRGRGHGARDRRGQAPHQPGHEAVQGQPVGRVRRHRQARRPRQGPGQVDHRLRRLRRPGRRHRRPGAPVRPVLERAGREPRCATTRRARKSRPSCWPSTSSASASRWASSSSTPTRSPASPRSTTAARLVTGKVKTVDPRGAEIQLNDDVTGYLRASEISRDRVEDARNVLKEGDEVSAMIINVDRKTRSIQLSIKAKDNADQQEAMQRLSQTQRARDRRHDQPGRPAARQARQRRRTDRAADGAGRPQPARAPRAARARRLARRSAASSMTRSDLVAQLAERFGQLTQRDTEFAVKTILDAMSDALARGHRIEIRGFGSFSINRRPPRVGRNPRCGEQVVIPEKLVPHFKPGKALREAGRRPRRRSTRRSRRGRRAPSRAQRGARGSAASRDGRDAHPRLALPGRRSSSRCSPSR